MQSSLARIYVRRESMSKTPASPLCVLCDSVFQNDDASDNLLSRLLLAAAQEDSQCHV